jgi:hypothetical protein
MPTAAITLTAFSLVAVSFSLVVRAAGRDVSMFASETAARTSALDVVEEILGLLENDPTPAASSFHDPLWRNLPEAVVLGEPVPDPGRVNVNRASRQRLEAVARGRLPAHVPPARALRGVYEAREKGELLTPESLERALGAYYRRLIPSITAAPPANVNTVDATRLRSLLTELVPEARVPDALQRLLVERERRELTSRDLLGLVRGAPEAEVHAALGVRSRAYSIEIDRGGYTFEAVLLRVGAADEFVLARFREIRP